MIVRGVTYSAMIKKSQNEKYPINNFEEQINISKWHAKWCHLTLIIVIKKNPNLVTDVVIFKCKVFNRAFVNTILDWLYR